MKKLILLFTVVFLIGFISAQSADVSFERGYRIGYKFITKLEPLTIPANPNWQTSLDQNFDGSKDQMTYNSQIASQNFGTGYSAGVKDAKADLRTKNESDFNKTKNSTKKNKS